MSERTTIENLLESLVELFRPVEAMLSGPDGDSIVLFLERFGVIIDDEQASDLRGFLNVADDISDLFQKAYGLAEASESQKPALYRDLFGDILSLVRKVRALKENAELPDSLNEIRSEIESFVRNLFEYLLISYTENNNPVLASLLSLLGVFEVNEIVFAESENKLNYYAKKIYWSRLKEFYSDPVQTFAGIYGWGKGGGDFGYDLLLKRLEQVFLSLGFFSGRFLPDYFLLVKYYDPLPAADHIPKVLKLPLFEDFFEEVGAFVDISLKIFPIPPEGGASQSPGAIVLVPHFIGSAARVISLGELFTLRLAGKLSSAVGIEIFPDKIRLKDNLFSPDDSTAMGEISATASIIRKSNEDLLLFGSANGTCFTVNGLGASLQVLGNEPENVEFTFEATVENAKLVIETGDGDSFLNKIFPHSRIISNFNLSVGYSTKVGLFIKGSSDLIVTIPIHKNIGPLKVDSAYLAVQINDDIVISMAVSAAIELGPISVSIKKIGITLPVKFPPTQDGLLGSLDIDFPQFLPPTGAGLAINTAGLSGGGFLEFDKDNRRYAGILHLKYGEIAITAIGLITTKMPDGSPGFSMVLNLSVLFSPAIQLPYNFSLMGVGGIVGVHRSVDTEVLRAGLRAKTLDSILFPEDPIRNADKIISDMRSAFPVAEGRFVFGPMVKIAWGANIITVDLCILLELPAPVRVLLLGQVAAYLPKLVEEKRDQTIVELHLDVVGILDFGKRELSIDATIFDSRILKFSLYGDAAIRMRWGEKPIFAMSLGGFHPAFSPPPGFPSLRRLTLALSPSSKLELSCNIYHAITSNSLQFGSKLQIHANYSGAKLNGESSFDTLFYFSPFSFTAHMSASVSVAYQGRTLASARLDLNLSGPTPWSAAGSGKFEIFIFDVDVDFHVTWGEEEQESLPEVDPLPPLLDDLGQNASWGASFIGITNLESFITDQEESEGIFLHPAAMLEIREKVLPLDRELDLYASAKVKNHKKFEITTIEIYEYSQSESEPGPCQGERRQSMDLLYIDEEFAAAQYFKKSDHEKLTEPSFEKMPGGVVAASLAIKSPTTHKYSEIAFENILIDEDRVSRRPVKNYELKWKRGMAGFSSKSRLAGGIGGRFANGKGKPAAIVQEIGYLLVDSESLQALEIEGNREQTLTQTKQLLKSYLKQNPHKMERVMILPAHELEVA